MSEEIGQIKESELFSTDRLKYIHIPAGNHFGVENPETVIVGGLDQGHRDIVRSYFESKGGKNVSEDEIEKIGFINAGLLLARKDLLLLTGGSGGLNVQRKTGGRIDIMRLSDEEKAALDKKTLGYLQSVLPNKNILSTYSI